MSFTKEAFANALGTGCSAWLDASPSRRCFACEGSSWCQIARDGAVVLCKRNDSGRAKVNRDGVTFYVHRRDVTVPRWVPGPTPLQCDRAPDEVLDRAYRVLFSVARATEETREEFRRRGLDDAAFVANGYGTMPKSGRARIAAAMLEAVGESMAERVPGLFRREADDGSRWWWSVGGAEGHMIPVRRADGLVVSVKIRASAKDAVQRYTYLSSAKRGGARAASVVHHPVAALAMRGRCPRVAVTEGPVKADCATHLLGLPVIAIPGVGEWRDGVDASLAFGAEVVAVAMDMDGARNKHVADATRQMIDGLRRAGARTELWQWDARWKGVDDYALALTRGEVIHAT